MIEIVYDGTNFSTFGAYCFPKEVDTTAEIEYEEHFVDGRKGVLLTYNGTMKNVPKSYGIVFPTDAQDNIEDFKAFLLAKRGYKRLETTLYPDEYYDAVFKAIEPNITMEREQATVVVEFEIKPQRWLKSGGNSIVIPQGSTSYPVVNPTFNDAYPMVRIYGTGEVNIGSDYITVDSECPYPYVDVDCELMNAFYNSSNPNQYVEFSTDEQIALHAGTNGVTLGSGITSVEITPRWYLL